MGKKKVLGPKEKIAELAGIGGVLSSGAIDEVVPYIITGKAVNFVVKKGNRILQKFDGSGSPAILCEETNLMDFSGWETTKENGEVVFRLSDLYCPRSNVDIYFDTPINLIAASRSKVAILTIRARINPEDARDVLLTCNSYGPDGNALGNVLFNWRLLAPVSFFGAFD